MDIFNRYRAWAIRTGIADQEPNRNGYIANKVEELGEYAEAMKQGKEYDAVDAIADSITFDCTELVKMGYDIEKVLNEVLMVVESRVGTWDNVNNKFQKDMSDEAKANWYSPRYDLCKEL